MASIDSLPPELLHQIFEKMCFHTVQRICTLVCKEWYTAIRNNPNLSSSLRLKLRENLPIRFFEAWSRLESLTMTQRQERYFSKRNGFETGNLKNVNLYVNWPILRLRKVKIFALRGKFDPNNLPPRIKLQRDEYGYYPIYFKRRAKMADVTAIRISLYDESSLKLLRQT